MHFEHQSIRLFIPGDKDQPIKDIGIPRNLSQYNLKKWIQNSELDDYTKIELIKALSKYPCNTINHFYNNIHKHIARIHQNRKKKDQ